MLLILVYLRMVKSLKIQIEIEKSLKIQNLMSGVRGGFLSKPEGYL